MADRGHIERAIRALYAARIADDIEGTLKDVAEDGVFKMNATSWRTPSLSSVWNASSLRLPSSRYHSRSRSPFPGFTLAVDSTYGTSSPLS